MINKKIHILGICGTFMGGLALLARESGYEVTGCDENIYPPMSDQLNEQGIKINHGYAVEDLPEADVYLIGNALSRGNEAVEYLLNKRANILSGPEWLYNSILRNKKVIAVSGTHGKTSTTAMIAWIFEYLGKNIGYLIAGKPNNFEVSSRLGTEEIFVIEADEYDTAFFDKRAKFIHYHPDILVLNNIEFDHADIYSDLSQILKQFHHLIRALPEDASIIFPETDNNIATLFELGCWSKKIGFSGNKNSDNYYGALTEDFSSSQIVSGEKLGTLSWSMLGEHNAMNAMSAVLACQECGVKVEDALEALEAFLGVARRQQLILENDKVILIDDFAHHPTAIKTTLRGLRDKYKSSRIIALIEMRSNTMKSGLHDDLLNPATEEADIVYWKSDNNNQLELLKANAPAKTKTIFSIEDTVKDVIDSLKPNDLIVTMSNGSFDGLSASLYKALNND
jgi:UDP-N-acetylmuramate: L-alanyl-gamma-D-glutamyl-meso-diaminopimelate ligase